MTTVFVRFIAYYEEGLKILFIGHFFVIFPVYPLFTVLSHLADFP